MSVPTHEQVMRIVRSAAMVGPMGLAEAEQLMAALVLGRTDWLAQHGCTFEQAIERLGPGRSALLARAAQLWATECASSASASPETVSATLPTAPGTHKCVEARLAKVLAGATPGEAVLRLESVEPNEAHSVIEVPLTEDVVNRLIERLWKVRLAGARAQERELPHR